MPEPDHTSEPEVGVDELQATFAAARTGVVAGDQDVALALLHELLDSIDVESRPRLLGAAATLVAEIHVLAGRLDDARPELRRAREVLHEAGAMVGAAICDHNLAVVLHADELGHDEAEVRLLRARSAFLEARRGLDVASCDFNLGVLLHDTGRRDDAVECYLRAREIFRARGRWEDAAACDQNLGVVLAELGRTVEARGRLRDASSVYGEISDEVGVRQCEENLELLAAEPGDV